MVSRAWYFLIYFFFFGFTYIWIPFYIFTGPSCYIMLKNVEHSPVIWLRMRIQPDRIIIFIRLKLISRPYIDHSILKIKLNGTVK